MKKLIVFAAAAMIAASGFAQIAEDNSSNYSTWATGDNHGTGFGVWTLTTSGTAGNYLGDAGGDTAAFGLWSNAGGSSSAFRPLSSGLAIGDVLSFTFGNSASVATGGEVGFSLYNNGTAAMTWKFVGGGSSWVMNDGGTDFGIGQNFAASTPLSFWFTWNGGNSYDYGFGAASGDNFTATATINDIDGVAFFSNNQGSSQNAGFDALEVNAAAVPEPATMSLLGLGALAMVLRRKMSK